MANYTTLKASVNAYIKANGVRAITGPVLNGILTQMINTLGDGARYGGIATPSGNPGTHDNVVFFLATTAGTYTNYGGAVLDGSTLHILYYDSTWHDLDTGVPTSTAFATKADKDEDAVAGNLAKFDSNGNPVDAGIAAEKINQLGKEVSAINDQLTGTEKNYALGGWNTDGNNAGSSSWYGVLDYIPVNGGDTIVWNPGAITGGIALIVYDSEKVKNDYFGANAVERTITLGANAAYIRPSFAVATFANAKIIRNGAVVWLPKEDTAGIKLTLDGVCYSNGVATDAYNGTHDNVSISNNKVILGANGVRLNFFGKQIFLVGPFEMSFASGDAQNGSWILDLQTLVEAVDGATITATSAIIKYAASNSNDIKNNVILFSCYYGQIYAVGVFGPALRRELQKQINKSINIGVIDGYNGTTRNVTLDEDNKKVTIKKEGLRIKVNDFVFKLSGSADFEMAYDSTSHANGGWFIKKSAVLTISNNGEITLSASNIVFYGVSEEANYRDNILLFGCYYGYVVPSGLLGSLILQRQIDAIKENNPAIALNDTKCKEFAAYFNGSGVAETFAFMTDPHLLGSSNVFDVAKFTTYIKTLQKYYDNTPVDWMICGGDWLNNGDYQDIACWKLGYMDAVMRKGFKLYFPILGNHDTNYQGVISASDNTRGDLAHQTLVNLMFRENGNTFYEWKGNNTRFLVFDTQTDWESTMDAFKWEQIAWLADKLLANTDEHIILLMHIYYSSGTTVAPMSENIQALAGAFNSRGAVTLNGETYNFSNANGKVACIVAGHSHFDAIDTDSSVPVWLTTNMMDGNVPTFDLMFVDYTAGKLKSVRIGTGSNREMTLAQ